MPARSGMFTIAREDHQNRCPAGPECASGRRAVIGSRVAEPAGDEGEPSARGEGRGRVDLHAQLREGEGVVGLAEVEGEELVELAGETGGQLGSVAAR